MVDLADQVTKYSMSLHADDTQLYLHLCRNEIVSSVDKLERCILDIGHWMSANRLKLNADNTELLFATSSHSCSTLSHPGTDTAVVCLALTFLLI